ncbi:MAG: AbrB/MazE/SpoVT family DNA-binding domain-containing protein [Candidatus Diapherotrites archaeon]|nr:AbrB/MazE/SpoVT family DNA-binding domain-containing protein [Candidatus Diapherotrites archaeon]
MAVRVRSVTMSERGQIVIPEDMRKDLKLGPGEGLVLIEKEKEIILMKETDVAKQLMEEERYWKALSEYSLSRAWDEKEDKVWDAFAKRELGRK